MPEENVLIEPKEVVRNNCENWTHPAVPDWGEGESFETIKAWFDAHQIEWRSVALEDDLSAEEYDKWQRKVTTTQKGGSQRKRRGLAGLFCLSITLTTAQSAGGHAAR